MTALLPGLVERAETFARLAHGDQRYGEFAYAIHLRAVVTVLQRFGVDDPVILAAGWLHDVLEDTQRTPEDLRLFFGEDVTAIVEALTEPKEGNRAARHAATYPKIRAHPWARLVKLADRIANVEAGGPLVTMYLKEHAAFKAALYPGGHNLVEDDMWAHLDNLLVRV